MHRFTYHLLRGLTLALVLACCVWTTAPVALAVTDADIVAIGEEQPADAAKAGEKLGAEPPSTMIWLGKTIVALGAVLGLLALVLWAVKRFMPQTTKKWTGGPIEIVATRSLGQRRSLMLVRVHGRTIFLGVTPQAINSLGEIDDPADWNSAAEAAGLELPAAPRTESKPQRGTTGIEGLER